MITQYKLLLPGLDFVELEKGSAPPLPRWTATTGTGTETGTEQGQLAGPGQLGGEGLGMVVN